LSLLGATPKEAFILKKSKPRTFHLDKRAGDLATKPDEDEDRPITTAQSADWLGVSIQFLEILRHTGGGPRYMRLGARSIRYTVRWLREWCEQRAHTHTKEYAAK
jgi:hypothetical protein